MVACDVCLSAGCLHWVGGAVGPGSGEWVELSGWTAWPADLLEVNRLERCLGKCAVLGDSVTLFNVAFIQSS